MTAKKTVPSYENLIAAGGGAGPARWKEQVAALKPGDVDVVETGDRVEAHVRSSLTHAAAVIGVKVVTRKRGGVLYVVRLRVEDVPKKEPV